MRRVLVCDSLSALFLQFLLLGNLQGKLNYTSHYQLTPGLTFFVTFFKLINELIKEKYQSG